MNHRSATGLIVVLTLVMAVVTGIYWGLSVDAYNRLPYLIWYIAWWWALTLWVVQDARERQVPLAFDQGLFIYLAWPVYIPVYLVRSRGPMGIVWVIAFAALYGAVAVAVGVVTILAWWAFSSA